MTAAGRQIVPDLTREEIICRVAVTRALAALEAAARDLPGIAEDLAAAGLPCDGRTELRASEKIRDIQWLVARHYPETGRD